MSAEAHFIHNPHAHDLYCEAVGDIVKAGQSVKATLEQVVAATRTGIFKASALRGEDGPELLIPASSRTPVIPVKKATAKRGTKTVETTAAAPEVETR